MTKKFTSTKTGQWKMTTSQSGATISMEEAHHQENPQTVSHDVSDHHTQLGCEASHLESAESTGSWEGLFDDDPLAYDGPEAQPEVASIASTDDFRESKRARIETASSAPAVNVDQLKFDSRAWEALLRDSLAPRLKTRAKFPWELVTWRRCSINPFNQVG